MLLVVIPLRSDHNDSLCTASYNVRTFTDEDPTTGNSPIFSSVRCCKCSPHKRKTNCQTRLQVPIRPLLYAFLMYTSRYTTCCYTRSHVCQPLIAFYFWANKLWLAAVRLAFVGRAGRRNIHTAIYIGVTLLMKQAEKCGSPKRCL